MDYLVDTVALVRHLRGGRKIGTRARQILREADAGERIVAISAVTLMEILYLSESRRIPIDLDAVRRLLKRSINYCIVPITPFVRSCCSKQRSSGIVSLLLIL